MERDTPIIDWSTVRAWSTDITSPTTSQIDVRSNGALSTKYATLSVRALTGAITARSCVAAGLHITGPKAGAEFTPYALSCLAVGGDSNVRPFLFVAESPATITNNAAGDAVTDVHWLAAGDTPGTDGSKLQADMVIVCNPNTADRALCFGVAMLAGVSAALDTACFVRLSVRRLIGVNPAILDTRKM